jgi:hypothetical protein
MTDEEVTMTVVMGIINPMLQPFIGTVRLKKWEKYNII